MGKRKPTIVGEIYHIYNRGVDKRVIFEDKSDFLRFLDGLYFFNTTSNIGSLYQTSFVQSEERMGDPLVEILAYNLLDNHFHIIVRQLVDGGISRFMKSVGGGYSIHFNDKYDRSGSLYQGPYKIRHVDNDAYLKYVLAYVHYNHHVHSLRHRVPKSGIDDIARGAALNGRCVLALDQARTILDCADLERYGQYARSLIEETVERRHKTGESKPEDGLVDRFLE